MSETDYLCFAADGYGGRAEAGEATGDPYDYRVIVSTDTKTFANISH